jgi:hypothetical protein
MKKLILVLCLSLPLYSFADDVSDAPPKNQLGMLIIAGDGLTTKYQDAKDSAKLGAFLIVVDQRIAEEVNAELTRRGVSTQLYINKNPDALPLNYIGQLIADHKRDGLVQVIVKQVKNETENTLYLIITYNPLSFGKAEKGEIMQVGKTTEFKRVLFSKEQDASKTTFGEFANDFADELEQAGYIDKH